MHSTLLGYVQGDVVIHLNTSKTLWRLMEGMLGSMGAAACDLRRLGNRQHIKLIAQDA